VKKLISILLITSILISGTEFYQIFKVPFLLEHFKEHKALNQGTTFWSFLTIHYSNNDIKYADYDKDMRLPFKSNEGSLHILSLSFIQYTSNTKLYKPFTETLKIYKVFNDHEFQSNYLSTIWQPPKSC